METKLLTSNELADVFKIVISKYENQLSLVNLNDPDQIGNEERFIASLYAMNTIHLFFLNRNLVSMTESIFVRESVRDFILSLTDQITIMLSVEDIKFDKLVNTILEGVYKNKKDSKYSLIPRTVKDQLSIDKDELFNILDNNAWVVCIYVLLLVYTGTSTYKELITDKR